MSGRVVVVDPTISLGVYHLSIDEQLHLGLQGGGGKEGGRGGREGREGREGGERRREGKRREGRREGGREGGEGRGGEEEEERREGASGGRNVEWVSTLDSTINERGILCNNLNLRWSQY